MVLEIMSKKSRVNIVQSVEIICMHLERTGKYASTRSCEGEISNSSLNIDNNFGLTGLIKNSVN